MSIFAVYGGSFDPPHDGHLKAFKLLIQQKLLNGIVFLPSGGNPFKKVSSSSADREKLISNWFMDLMTEIDAKKISDDQWLVREKTLILDFQALRNQESSTLSSLERIESYKLADELVIAIGSDLVNQVQSWQFSEQLIQRYCFLVIPRGGYQRVFPASFRELAMDLSNFQPCALSSTMLRGDHDKSYE